jgi:hypothetical protein
LSFSSLCDKIGRKKITKGCEEDKYARKRRYRERQQDENPPVRLRRMALRAAGQTWPPFLPEVACAGVATVIRVKGIVGLTGLLYLNV